MLVLLLLKRSVWSPEECVENRGVCGDRRSVCRPEECVQADMHCCFLLPSSVSCGGRPCAQRILLPPLSTMAPLPRLLLHPLPGRGGPRALSGAAATFPASSALIGEARPLSLVAPSSRAPGLSGGALQLGGGGAPSWCLPAACHLNLL